MQTESRALAAAAALVVLATSVVLAGLREVEPGVWVEDFEQGALDPRWRVDERAAKASLVPQVLEIVRDGGKAALHLKGRGAHNKVYYQDRTFKDFALEVRMRKTSGNYAGMIVRDHWHVFFQMRCFLEFHSDLKGFEGSLFKSGEEFKGNRTLKVVCAGPLLHAYVDGRHVFSHRIAPGEGRIGLYAHGDGEAIYDDLRIDTRMAPEHYLLVEPQAPDDGLVFSPHENVALRFKVSNFADAPQRVTVAASIRTWAGVVVKERVEREVGPPAGADAVAAFDMGRVPAGLYRLDLQASCGARQVCRIDDLPLAVQERGRGEFKAPTIPVAAYYKYFNPKAAVYVNTYAHAAARSLKDHRFNAVVADPSFTRAVVDIFQRYGIATIARGASLVDHPAVIATLAHDEPKPQEMERLRQDYDSLRAATGKPITTCMVGESMGLGTEGDPVLMWKQLDPTLRCFRWYGIKKDFYGLLHDPKYKGWLPLASVLRIAEASSDTPYWFVAPALGKTDHEAYYHKPSPAETRGMMHLALAYGADGLLFWALQSHGTWPCFVDQRSLEPTDGNYAAAAEVAALVETHADLLAALRHGGCDVRCPSPAVEARPLRDTRDERVYVYVVNKDARSPVSTRLLWWADTWAVTSVQDVYTGRRLAVKPRDEEGYLSVPVDLEAGAGQLLATDVAARKP